MNTILLADGSRLQETNGKILRLIPYDPKQLCLFERLDYYGQLLSEWTDVKEESELLLVTDHRRRQGIYDRNLTAVFPCKYDLIERAESNFLLRRKLPFEEVVGNDQGKVIYKNTRGFYSLALFERFIRVQDKQGHIVALCDYQGNAGILPYHTELFDELSDGCFVAGYGSLLVWQKSRKNILGEHIGSLYRVYDLESDCFITETYDQWRGKIEWPFVIRGYQFWNFCNQNSQTFDLVSPDLKDKVIKGCSRLCESFAEIKNEADLKGVYSFTEGIIIEPDYHFIRYVDSDFKGFEVRKSHKVGLFDVKGKMIIPPEFDHIDIRLDYILVRKNKKEGIYAKDGKVIFPPRYKNLKRLNDGSWLVTKDGKQGIAKDYKHWIKRLIYSEIIMQNYGIVFRRQKQICGEDFSGKRIVPWGDYDEIALFPCGAIVEKKGLFCFFNHKGKRVIGFDYEEIEFLFDETYDRFTHLRVCQNDQFGVCTIEGQILIAPAYDSIKMLDTGCNGLFFVCYVNDRCGLTDARGNLLLEPKYRQIKYRLDEFLAEETFRFRNR